MKYGFLVLIILTSLSCNTNITNYEPEKELDYKIISRLMDTVNILENSIMLSNFQGDFASVFSTEDTLLFIYYNSSILYKQHKDEQVVEVLKNRYLIGSIPENIIKTTGYVKYDTINNKHLTKASEIEKYFIYENDSIFTIDWEQANKNNITSIYSISKLAYFSEDYGFIALQDYSRGRLVTLYFSFFYDNGVKLEYFGMDNVEVIRYLCYKNKESVINFKPVEIVIKNTP